MSLCLFRLISSMQQRSLWYYVFNGICVEATLMTWVMSVSESDSSAGQGPGARSSQVRDPLLPSLQPGPGYSNPDARQWTRVQRLDFVFINVFEDCYTFLHILNLE